MTMVVLSLWTACKWKARHIWQGGTQRHSHPAALRSLQALSELLKDTVPDTSGEDVLDIGGKGC